MYNETIAKTHNYTPLYGIFEIKNSNIDGQGLFVKEGVEIPKGKVYDTIGLNPIITHVDVAIGKENYFFRTPVGGFINHSDNPNTKLVKNIFGQMTYFELEALRDIKSGEEITLCYGEAKICVK